MRLLFLFLLAVRYSCGFKVVILGSTIINSQIIFSARIAEALADAGNDVTLVLIDFYEDSEVNVNFNKNIKVYNVNASSGSYSSKMYEQQTQRLFEEFSFFNSEQRYVLHHFAKMGNDGCRAMVRNESFLHWLESEKFDVAFSYTYHMCPVGLLHKAKISAWIWLNSGGLADFVAYPVGVPIIPSYVSPMPMEAHDEMTFFERTKSVIGHALIRIVWPIMFSDPETAIFRESFGNGFPDLQEIASNCPLVMVNTDDLYDLPRPTLVKVINIGGVGYRMKAPEPLAPEFQSIVDKAKGIVIFTFGSHAPVHKMPLDWKNAFLGAFKQFSQFQFIVRYKETDLNDRLPSNVHLFKWLPQSDLLQNNKTKAFISHGGYNSLQETIAAGVPLVTIPLFGDQYKNSKIAEKHGFAIGIPKSTISERNIFNALKEVLENDKYAKKVKRLSSMVRKQPFGPEDKLVKWTEFLAEFKTLENLQPAAAKLNFIQYHSIDVYALFLAVLFIILAIVFKIVKCTSRRVRNFLGKSHKGKMD